MSKRFLSTGEAARVLGISRVAVFKRIKSGQLKANKVGGRYLIESSQLGLHYKKLGSKEKREIRSAVKKVFKEYGDVLKKLGNE